MTWIRSIKWRHNGRDGVSNHQPHDCLCTSHIQPRTLYDFNHAYDFLPVRPSEPPVGILRGCISPGHINYWSCMARHGCTHMVWWNNSPRVPCVMPARQSHGPRTIIFNVFNILREPCGNVRDPQGCRTTPLRTRKGIETTRIGKIPARASYMAVRGPYEPLTDPHGLFTGCLQYQIPFGARKLIMHALKLYGPRTGRQNSYGTAWGPFGPREWTYDFCSKQPGNSPGTARKGPGSVMWLGHYSTVYSDADQWKHQSSASLAFVRGIHRGPVISPHKWPVTRKNVSIWWRHHTPYSIYTVNGWHRKSPWNQQVW